MKSLRKRYLFAFLVTAFFLMPWSLPWAYASSLIEGRITSIDHSKNSVTIFDFADEGEKVVTVPDLKGIKKGCVLRMRLYEDDNGRLMAKSVEKRKGHDATGMKKRLRKALNSMHGRGGRGHGHRCRCR